MVRNRRVSARQSQQTFRRRPQRPLPMAPAGPMAPASPPKRPPSRDPLPEQTPPVFEPDRDPISIPVGRGPNRGRMPPVSVPGGISGPNPDEQGGWTSSTNRLPSPRGVPKGPGIPRQNPDEQGGSTTNPVEPWMMKGPEMGGGLTGPESTTNTSMSLQGLEAPLRAGNDMSQPANRLQQMKQMLGGLTRPAY